MFFISCIFEHSLWVPGWLIHVLRNLPLCSTTPLPTEDLCALSTASCRICFGASFGDEHILGNFSRRSHPRCEGRLRKSCYFSFSIAAQLSCQINDVIPMCSESLVKSKRALRPPRKQRKTTVTDRQWPGYMVARQTPHSSPCCGPNSRAEWHGLSFGRGQNLIVFDALPFVLDRWKHHPNLSETISNLLWNPPSPPLNHPPIYLGHFFPRLYRGVCGRSPAPASASASWHNCRMHCSHMRYWYNSWGWAEYNLYRCCQDLRGNTKWKGTYQRPADYSFTGQSPEKGLAKFILLGFGQK